MVESITLGDPRVGIELGNWRFKIPGKFVVDEEHGVVVLRHDKLKLKFQLGSDGRHAYLWAWDQQFLFEPMLNLPRLRRRIGLRS